ncbi:MAG: choice-of-anchor D domain-containing protein [Bryobacteraceae bacterium]
MKAAVALFLPCLAIAQLQLYVAPQGSEVAVSGVYDLGATSVGERLDTRFRIRNAGQVAANLTSLSIAGSGFTLFGQPSLPHIVAPGTNVDFTVRFSPANFGAYSANIAVNGLALLVRASATAGAILEANGSAINSGETVDFGRVERSQRGEVKFRLLNPVSQAVRVSTLVVTGTAFQARVRPLPIEIAPRGIEEFQIIFEPKSAGIHTGTLTVDGRAFRLTGASEPPLPRLLVVLEPPVLTSGQQGKVSIRFGETVRASGVGQVKIEFRPAGVADNDSAIQFIKSSSRAVPVSVSPGSSFAMILNEADSAFQTGTTAGTMVFTVELGGYTEQTSVTIAPALIMLDSVKASRTGNALEVQLTGFDNTRTVGQVSFTFFDRSGNPVQPGIIRLDAGSDFKRHFESSKLGGLFFLRAAFPVAGDASGIVAAEAQIVNSNGTTKTQRLQF